MTAIRKNITIILWKSRAIAVPTVFFIPQQRGMESTMKKLTALILAAVLTVSLCITCCAASILQEVGKIDEIPDFRYYSKDETFGCEVSQRGFAMTEDGKYIFSSFLFGDAGVVKFDAKTGDPLAVIHYPYTEPKSIAVDDRGYLYVGLSNTQEKNYYTICVVDQNTMKEVSRFKFTLNKSGQAGLNGMTVAKENGKYILYASINYKFALIAAHDVTDINNIYINESFCRGGYMDLIDVAEQVEKAGYEDVSSGKAEVQCFDLDEDGNFYLAMCLGIAGKKADAVVKVTHDGKYICATECYEAYGVDYYEGYVFVVTYVSGFGYMAVLDGDTLEIMEEVEPESVMHGEFVGVKVFPHAIYIADQRSNGESSFLKADVNFPGKLPEPPKTTEPDPTIPAKTTETTEPTPTVPAKTTEPTEPTETTEPIPTEPAKTTETTEPVPPTTADATETTEPPVTDDPRQVEVDAGKLVMISAVAFATAAMLRFAR